MAATTPKLALPYPIPDDSVDVPRDVKALADKLDTLYKAMNVPVVTSLPALSTVDDGQQVIWTPDPVAMQCANYPAWRMVARKGLAGATPPDQWACLGGAPAYSQPFPRWDHVTSGAWTFWVGGYQLTIPTNGVYRIQFSGFAMRHASAATGNTAYRFGVANTSGARYCEHEVNLLGGSGPSWGSIDEMAGTAPGDTAKMGAYASTNLGQTVILNIMSTTGGPRLKIEPVQAW
jgi:hypothetical protein